MTQEPTSFPLFSLLPPEIRLKIWSNLIPPPRIVQVAPRNERHGSPLVSLTKPPLLLSITHESRSVALSTYTYLPIPHIPAPVSLSRDILYVSFTQLPGDGYGPVNSLLNAVLSLLPHFAVHTLALDSRSWVRLCDKHNLFPLLASMPHLREVIRVVEFGRDFKGELGFLELPVWRRDLREAAERAELDLKKERKKLEAVEGEMGDIKVRVVILTKGGEMA